MQKNRETAVIIKNYSITYGRVKQSVQAQSGVTVWFHKSMSGIKNHTKYWSKRERIMI